VTKLKVASIFLTINGEVPYPGTFSVFIRLGGCNLRCWKSSGFCDAPHTLKRSHPYREMTVDEIVAEAERLMPRHPVYPARGVTITGGEPLIQDGVYDLIRALDQSEFCSILETSGSIMMVEDQVDLFDHVVVDMKPPSTEMVRAMKFDLFSILRPGRDIVKFVLSDRRDYEWAQGIIETIPDLLTAFGVRWGHLDIPTLMKWLEEDRLFRVRLNVQTHKYIWPECEPPPVLNLNDVDYEKCAETEH
jgi:7-carboxy-7-deazaguanine synthase